MAKSKHWIERPRRIDARRCPRNTRTLSQFIGDFIGDRGIGFAIGPLDEHHGEIAPAKPSHISTQCPRFATIGEQRRDIGIDPQTQRDDTQREHSEQNEAQRNESARVEWTRGMGLVLRHEEDSIRRSGGMRKGMMVGGFDAEHNRIAKEWKSAPWDVHPDENDPPSKEFKNSGNQFDGPLSLAAGMKTHRSSALALGLLAATSFCSSVASADMFRATRSEKLVEKSHKIDIQVAHGYADLRVRRTVHNGGPRHDQATFYIDMPEGAVAIGLRTLGVLDGKPHWFAGELLEAEAAAARYRELTGVGGYYPKDPALLSWRHQSLLALQVFPCAPGEDKTIEYTLRVPTEYRDGRYHLVLPSMGTETLFAQASVTSLVPGETVFIGDKPVSTQGWVHLKEEVDLSVAPITSNLLDGGLASLPVNSTKNIAHYHIEAAPRLGTVPVGAHAVVLIDNSRSLSEPEHEQELAMARSYLGHFASGRIAIVPFDRRARTLTSGFVSAPIARSALHEAKMERNNGSNVDEALAHADALLAKAPAGAARRILLLTDTRTRAEITPEMLKSKLGRSGALMHIGVVTGHSRSELERNDNHAWNAVTRPSGGLVWDAAINTYSNEEAENAAIFEEWARPKRIDHLRIHLRGSSEKQGGHPDTLGEGQSIEELQLPKTAISAVEISGELWATPIKKEFVPNDAENQRWAGLFFGTHTYTSLTEEEMMPLAMLGKVVSPVTSYLAIEPGVRPSTEGLEEMSGTGIGFGSGFGSAGDRLHGIARVKYPDTKEAFLQREVQNALTNCGAKDRKARTSLETTVAEIVGVKASIDGENANSVMTNCFEEGIWNITLRGDFRSDYEVFTVAL
jgi:von Willebrand factor type A domain